MTITDFLSRFEGVRSRGNGKFMARCPAHNDKNPSLSIQEGERGLLLRCWTGCSLAAITDKIGISIQELFYDQNPLRRREAMQRRDKKLAAQRAEQLMKGRRVDALRHAEYLIQSAKGLSIDEWSNEELHRRLNALAEAYKVLEREHHD